MISQSSIGVVDISKIKFASYSNKKYNIEIINGKKKCIKCDQWKALNGFTKDKSREYGLDFCCIVCNRAYDYKEARRIKLICMMGYRGCCQCCGERNIELLTIEHIRGKGHELIYQKNTVSLMRKLISSSFPDGYTCLCYNCNMSSRNNIPCVHSLEHKKYINKYIAPYPYEKQKELDELEHKWDTMKGKLICQLNKR